MIFFRPHLDRIGDYTALLYPESLNCKNLRGGNMIIGSFELDASNLKTHTLLIFRTDLIHEVTEILEGTRYVMKISLFKEESLEAMNEIEKEITPVKSTEPNTHHFLKKNDEKIL